MTANEKACAAYARNAGVAASSGHGIVFLDQDDESAPGYLETMAKELGRHSFVAARLDNDSLNTTWAARSLQPWHTDRLMNGWGFFPMQMLVR